ncbi:MAG: glycoside hydrolase family 18 [Porphyromonas sp.]|nr:glycoside hydrolase family 18 [Porphyromonas sp.]
MNKNVILSIIGGVLLTTVLLTGCSNWTTPEQKAIEHIGGYATMDNEESEAYYQSLREWKAAAVNNARPISYGYFSNWAPTGPMRKGYLSALPDSIDMVSMWSGTPAKDELTEAQAADKSMAQKKGIKLLNVTLLSHLGKGLTPDSAYEEVNKKAQEEGWSDRELSEARKIARWNYWGFKSGDFNNPDLYDAISKFAKAYYDFLEVNEWDGIDIDWEPGIGFNDADGTFTVTTMTHFVKELGKYMGPASDPQGKGHKILCIDGLFEQFPDEIAEYVDYFIEQAYFRMPYMDVPGGDYKKLVVVENFESGFASGGRLLQQAAWMPDNGQYKGGIGAYRLDNDYNNSPDYKWMRQAIQINLQMFEEWKVENAK